MQRMQIYFLPKFSTMISKILQEVPFLREEPLFIASLSFNNLPFSSVTLLQYVPLWSDISLSLLLLPRKESRYLPSIAQAIKILFLTTLKAIPYSKVRKSARPSWSICSTFTSGPITTGANFCNYEFKRVSLFPFNSLRRMRIFSKSWIPSTKRFIRMLLPPG